jgi:hypothetical protein
MAQIFHPAFNTIAKASILGFIVIIGGALGAAYAFQKSPYYTEQGYPRSQPVPFSHEHHVNGLGIDCRYCHTSVEDSSFAGIPATETCMTCHSKIFTEAPMLEPVRQSWRTNQPIKDAFGEPGWTRVHVLPEFVYFNHSIHINKGIGCVSCHGQVNEMPLMYQNATLQMEWCLSCHREPEKQIRPRDKVFDMHYDLDAMTDADLADLFKKHNAEVPASRSNAQRVLGEALLNEYHVAPSDHLTKCYVCHR